VTIDYETKENQTVTIRDRDTMEQIRVNTSQLKSWLLERIQI
ncbi:MAG: hypothetical protein K9M19_07475, partial [Candidatus Marinimicrobia bacterium]|nr:hypothetical protein [Candidatus Neomarinimicrobiota bacterium]